MMKKPILILIIIVFFSSGSLSYAGFIDDVFKAINDGIKQGVQQGLNQDTKNINTRGVSTQRQAQDERIGEEFYNSGIQLREKGRHREAISEVEKAVPIARAYNNSFGEMNCLLIIGLSYHDLKDDKNAIKYFNNVLDIAKRSGDKEREKTALSMLAVCYQSLNDYSNAINYDEQKLMFVQTNGTKEEEIEVLNTLSRDLFFKDDTIKAMSYLEQGLVLSQKIGNKQLEMEHLAQLGNLHHVRGYISKALFYTNKALELTIELNDENKHYDYLMSLGQIYSQLGDYVKAIKLLNQSLAFQRTAKNEFSVMLSLYDLGHVYEALGDYPTAIKYYEQSHSVAQNINFNIDEDSGILAIAYLLNGNITTAKEKVKSSKAELYKSFFYLLSDRPRDAIKKLPKDELLSYPQKLFVTNSRPNLFGLYTVMGLAYEKLGDFKTAQNCFKTAVDVVDRLREELKEDDRYHFWGAKDYPPFDRLSPYDGLIRTSAPGDAFAYSETIKARIFLEQIAGKYDKSDFKIPSIIKSQDIDLDDSLADIFVKQDMALKSNDKVGVVQYEQEILNLREKKDSLVEKLYKDYPQYATIKYPRPLQLQQLKLNSDEVLIEYAVTDTQTLGWLIRNNKIIKTVTVQIGRKDLEILVDNYRKDLVAPPASKLLQDFNAEAGNKLYTVLLKDFMPLIGDEDKIIIVPDKKLGLLPFEALVTHFAKTQKQISNITFLGDTHDIIYYQSASALTMLRSLKKDARPKKALFVLADPVFDISDSRLNGTKQRVSAKKENAFMQAIEEMGGECAQRLDKTSVLADKLLEMFKNHDTEYLTGIEANEDNLKKEDLSKYRYVVFATHGVLNSKLSGVDEPALLLSQIKNNSRGNNGFLTMTKVMGLKLNCDVAVLAACEMASGKLVSGEGVMGMGRAFQYAGAKSVLASLWSVSEDSTINLVERFFYYLQAGKDKSSALRLARNDIKKIGYEHPFFWAPFILIGESR